MKKIIAVLFVAIFATAVIAFAAADAKPELRPAQKIMQARVAWLAAIKANLGSKNYEAITKNADELAAQTKKVGENNPNPLGKELTLAISSFAKDISVAAAKKDDKTIKAKLGEINGKCGECHAKIRDKK
jgi:cytochrome c556